MTSTDYRNVLDKDRAAIAEKVRKLRLSRHLNQAELARRLGLSQSRLSEIERGTSSFTAEQFLSLLRLFGADAAEFAAPLAPEPEAELRSTLARLRALYLRGSDVLPSEQLRRVSAALREVLGAPRSANLIPALAPVLVHNVDVLHLPKIRFELGEARLERRLGWLLENTVGAIASELSGASRAFWRKLRRASSMLDDFVQALAVERPGQGEPPDVVDPEVRDDESLQQAVAMSSPISRRWAIVSRLQCRDFAEALRAAQDGG